MRRPLAFNEEADPAMIWYVLLFVVALVVGAAAIAWVARRRDLVTISTAEPMSTMHLGAGRGGMTAEKRAALRAANQVLR